MGEALPRISLITPCWNSARTLGKTFRSVAAQSYPDLEYIVVDGGSTDSTLDMIKAEPLVTRWVSGKDKGVYDAMNKGLRLATGDWVGILNSDDAYVPGVLAKVAGLASQGKWDVLYADIRMMYAGRSPYVYRSAPALSLRTFWQMPIWHPTVFVRRQVYEEDGIFSDGFRISADYELMLRLFVQGRRFLHTPEIWVEMDAGGLSDTRWMEGKREIRRAAEGLGVFTLPMRLLSDLDNAKTSLAHAIEGMPLASSLQRVYRELKGNLLRRR